MFSYSKLGVSSQCGVNTPQHSRLLFVDNYSSLLYAKKNTMTSFNVISERTENSDVPGLIWSYISLCCFIPTNTIGTTETYFWGRTILNCQSSLCPNFKGDIIYLWLLCDFFKIKKYLLLWCQKSVHSQREAEVHRHSKATLCQTKTRLQPAPQLILVP